MNYQVWSDARQRYIVANGNLANTKESIKPSHNDAQLLDTARTIRYRHFLKFPDKSLMIVEPRVAARPHNVIEDTKRTRNIMFRLFAAAHLGFSSELLYIEDHISSNDTKFIAATLKDIPDDIGEIENKKFHGESIMFPTLEQLIFLRLYDPNLIYFCIDDK